MYHRLDFTRHARAQMRVRAADVPDVERACITATVAVHERDDVWKLSGGVDRVGDILIVIAAIDPAEVWVITVTGDGA